jgi:hypothetical protein
MASAWSSTCIRLKIRKQKSEPYNKALQPTAYGGG